jgi:hypothetical protein
MDPFLGGIMHALTPFKSILATCLFVLANPLHAMEWVIHSTEGESPDRVVVLYDQNGTVPNLNPLPPSTTGPQFEVLIRVGVATVFEAPSKPAQTLEFFNIHCPSVSATRVEKRTTWRDDTVTFNKKTNPEPIAGGTALAAVANLACAPESQGKNRNGEPTVSIQASLRKPALTNKAYLFPKVWADVFGLSVPAAPAVKSAEQLAAIQEMNASREVDARNVEQAKANQRARDEARRSFIASVLENVRRNGNGGSALLASWIGSSGDDLIRKWGRPNTVRSDNGRQIIYTQQSVSNVMRGGMKIGEVAGPYCHTSFFTDPRYDVITGYRTEGTGC